MTAPIEVVIGNPPFVSRLTTEGAQRSYEAYQKAHGSLPDMQLAYLFLHEAMEILAPDGVLAMIEPAGFLYNQKVFDFRKSFFGRWTVREVLDFVSVRGLFRKAGADPKVIVVVAEATRSSDDNRLLHAVFRRSGRVSADQGFDIDYYDMHWFPNPIARASRDIWRANLLGGNRVQGLIRRLREFPTLRDYTQKREWDFGAGYIAGRKGESQAADHLVGKPLLPTDALSIDELDIRKLQEVPDKPIERSRTARRFTPPLLLIKKHEDLYSVFFDKHFLAYSNAVVGIAAPPEDKEHLSAVGDWLRREVTVLQAYAAGTSVGLFSQRASALMDADIFALPYPEDENLDLSKNEQIIASDIVEYQRDFIRLGVDAAIMGQVSEDALTKFNDVFVGQINAVYTRNRLRPLPAQRWPGAICKAYVFGNGEVDWSGANELRQKLHALLREQRNSGLTITRITRLYDGDFLFLLKPNLHRFWTRSIALRDADDVFADLRAQGF